MKTVQGNTLPPLVEVLQGTHLLNVYVKEMPSGGFEYLQLRIDTLQDAATQVEALYGKLLAEQADKCAGALRSKVLGVSIEYDEALLMDAELECTVLHAMQRADLNRLEELQ